MKNHAPFIILIALLIPACEKESMVDEKETIYDTIYQYDTIIRYDTLLDTVTLVDTIIIIPDSAEISYSKHIQPIWNKNCIVCHDQNSTWMKLAPCCSYDEIVPEKIDELTPHNSSIYSIVESGLMPPGPNKLTQVELAYILEWIKRGALDN